MVGDTLYAPNHPAALGFDRLALHAKKIVFKGPNSELYQFETPLPADFETAVSTYFTI